MSRLRPRGMKWTDIKSKGVGESSTLTLQIMI